MALIARDDSVRERVINAFTPACFEWNITKGAIVYNKSLLDLIGLPASETLSIENVISAKYIVDKDVVFSEVYRILDYVQRLQCK